MSKVKKLFTNFRILLLLAFLVMAVVAINPSLSTEGVAIRNVVHNSSAAIAGIQSPNPADRPRSREVITSVNNIVIHNVEEFYDIVNAFDADVSFSIQTSKGSYRLVTQPLYNITVLNETEKKVFEETVFEEEEVNGTLENVSKKVNVTHVVPKTISTLIGVKDIGLKVYKAPENNIKEGLDLTGGTRVLLQPEEKLSDSEMEILLDNMKQRLNVYGLTDIVVRKANDLSGNQFIVVEIAGANEEEVKDLLSKQGKFEAKVGDTVVFRGGQDITYVCRSADCSGIDPNTGCGQTSDGNWACRFRFSITLSQDAANQQADATRNLDVITVDENGNQLDSSNHYLSEQLALFLDDQEVDRLNIGASLKGAASTDIMISGSGSGTSYAEASKAALENMKHLQTILITGSLPVKLNIVKTDVISPTLGKEFVKNALLVGLYSIIAVAVVIFIRFRKIQVALPMAFTMFAELILILGMAALIGWNLDLAAIAGIIVAIGTGVDDQIVITDETLRGEKTDLSYNWQRKLKNAFFIIMAAYSTTMVAMLPLLGAGAGLLKGFALTTMMGVTFGVFLTRPSYAAIIEILLKD